MPWLPSVAPIPGAVFLLEERDPVDHPAGRWLALQVVVPVLPGSWGSETFCARYAEILFEPLQHEIGCPVHLVGQLLA